MSQIMKAFTGIFIVLFMTASSMGILGAFLQVSKAQEYHAAMIDELENSDYSTNVLMECLHAAKENGYKVEITLYEKNGGCVMYSESEDVPKEIQQIDMAKVDMKFMITIPFFGVKNEQKISGYGR